MNFSEVFKLSNQLSKFSPNGKFLASCIQYRLVVRDVSTLQVLQLYTCLDQIQHLEWSADSLFILCAMYKRGLVQIWSLEQPEWHCKIDEGSAGLVASCWSPDGRHILNTTEFHHFDTDTQDLAGIEWAPNGCVLAAWDSCLEYKILLYSLDGRLLSTYCAYEWSLGIKNIAWSPSSQFLAIGSYDEKVRILNHVTWKMITEFGHTVTINNPKIVVYKEMEKSQTLEMENLPFPPTKAAASSLFNTESKYEVASSPVSLQTLKPVADRPNPKIGIGILAFSPDNCFLATRNDNIPNAVWIWDVQKLKLFVVLEHLSAVRSFQWDPQQARLAVCTGRSQVYLWSPAGCLSVQVPAEGDFQILSLCWHRSGNSMALLSKDQLCLCYLENAEIK
ncbi:WD repeat-containing protein WRAP73 isoform X3 [Macrotis lagotis]|uniref:WD repeat-containing protein WRAP73 isoform X3 n=1 Tax=Macrotis lagotis TaxID=92651 RepID=UPI003D69A51B